MSTQEIFPVFVLVVESECGADITNFRSVAVLNITDLLWEFVQSAQKIRRKCVNAIKTRGVEAPTAF